MSRFTGQSRFSTKTSLPPVPSGTGPPSTGSLSSNRTGSRFVGKSQFPSPKQMLSASPAKKRDPKVPRLGTFVTKADLVKQFAAHKTQLDTVAGQLKNKLSQPKTLATRHNLTKQLSAYKTQLNTAIKQINKKLRACKKQQKKSESHCINLKNKVTDLITAVQDLPDKITIGKRIWAVVKELNVDGTIQNALNQQSNQIFKKFDAQNDNLSGRLESIMQDCFKQLKNEMSTLVQDAL